MEAREQSYLNPYCLQDRLHKNISRQKEQMTKVVTGRKTVKCKTKFMTGGLRVKVLYCMCCISNNYTVKPVLSGHSKIDKTMILKTNGSLMKVQSIAECSLGAFCNTFDLH